MNDEKKTLRAAMRGFPLPTEVPIPVPQVKRNNTDELAAQVVERLHQLHPGAPFFMPKQIGPVLGISDNAFTVYCRKHPALKLWRGSYRFHTDDPGHMKILRRVIGVVLWSGIKVPDEFRPSGRGNIQ